MNTRFYLAALFLLFCSASLASKLALPANNSPPEFQQHEFLPAHEAFPFKYSISDKVIQVHWQTSEDYYLYAESIHLKDKQNPGIKLEPKFNKIPLIKFDPNFDKDMAIFKGELIANFWIDQKIAFPVIRFQGCAEAGLCYPMQEIALGEQNNLPVSNTTQNQNTSVSERDYLHSLLQDASLFKIITIFLLLGIGLCLTPCVLPMMPIISSLVLGREKALTTFEAFSISSTYVLSMTITYTLAGVLAASLGAGANIQIWMQEPLVLTLFAILFCILALSMFDVYELKLPQILTDKLHALSNQQHGGNYAGAASMGFLSAIVVSPCISAPLAGALVFISTTGDVIIGGSALFALGLGMGLPLILLCTFGTNLLPKTGDWLNYSKRFFGLLLIAVAIWLLSRFLHPSLILALWGALLILSSFCFGSWGKADILGKTILIILFLWGLMMIIGAALGNSNPLQPLENLQHQQKQTTHKNSKLNFVTITSINELEHEILANKDSGKILLLDFYADWCTSCKEIEQEIFDNPQFEAFLNKTHLVRADLSDNSLENFELLETLNLFGPPAILFYTDQGAEIENLRIQGTISSKDFQILLDKYL